MNVHDDKMRQTGETRPFLAPSTPEATRPYTSSPSGITRPVTATVPQVSSITFLVHPGMPEVVALAESRGWLAQGFTTLSVAWVELHWTLDAWKTPHVLRSTDVPCPVVNGAFFLPNVPVGADVEFAVHAGLACHAPQDTAGIRETSDLWFNNAGVKYHQTTI